MMASKRAAKSDEEALRGNLVPQKEAELQL